MRNGNQVIGAAVLGLMMGTPVWAADGADVTSYFEMFFVSSDVIGQVIILMLIILSLFVVGYWVKLALAYRRSTLMPAETQTQIEQMIANKQYREAIEFAKADSSYLGKLVSSALTEASNGYGAMERAVEEAGDAETTRRLRPVEYLNVIGSVAPMLGLFGTVYGMIRAFQKLVEAGGTPNPADLAGGISTALVTTLWGLIVAMPALVGYALIRNKVDALTSEGMLVAEELIRPFRPGGSSRKGATLASGGGIRPATPKPQ
jgi:biopolymer transport protein ExbB